MDAERAIALELRFVEPLICRRFVGEFRTGARVVVDVDRLVSRPRRLHVDEESLLGLRAVDRAVVDRRHGRVQVRLPLSVLRHLRRRRERDRHAEVDADLANRVAEILERVPAVAAGIADDDVVAAAEHHLVHAEVVEVSAIREIHVRVGVGRAAEHLAEQRRRTPARIAQPPCVRAGRTRIAEPRAQTRVEQRQEERERRRRLRTLIGRDRRARERHRGAERDLLAVLVRRAVADQMRPAVQRRDRERLRLPILPRELVRRHEVERRIDDVERPLNRSQIRHADVVARIEAGERIRLALHARARRAEERANEPRAIHPVQRELVDVDEIAHREAEDHENAPQRDDLVEAAGGRMLIEVQPRRLHVRQQ